MSSDQKLLCYNRGCGKQYLEGENNRGRLKNCGRLHSLQHNDIYGRFGPSKILILK